MRSLIEQAIASGVHDPNYYQGGTPYFGDAPTDDDLARAGIGSQQGGGQQNQRGNFLKEQGGNIAGGALAGLSGYAQGQASTQDFSIDPNAGFKGSFQGLASGGVVGAITGGIGSQIGTFSEVNRNLKNIQSPGSFVRRDAVGRPNYSGDAYLQGQNTVRALDEGEKAIKKSIDPATRVFSGLFGTRKKIRKARERMEDQIEAGQKEFNTASQAFDQEQIAQTEYRRRRNMTNRLYNLYSTPQTIGY